MPSSEEYLYYVLDLLRETEGISYKKMMGEYLLYQNGLLFGGVYDDRFLIKKTTANQGEGLREEIPYEGAKPMFLVDSEDSEIIRDLVEKTIQGLRKK